MIEDRDIIKLILDGDVDNFEQLIEKYKDKVFTIIRKRIPYQEQNEIAQNIFLKAFQSLSNFNLNKPFENWLSRIALYSCSDYWRAHSKKRVIEFSESENYNYWLQSAIDTNSLKEFESKVHKEDTFEFLQIILNKLRSDDRLLIEMLYFEGDSMKEVSLNLNWSLSKVKVRAMRAREKMRIEIKKLATKK